MALSDEITSAFAELYDDFRNGVQDAGDTLRLYNKSGTLITTLTTGWVTDEQSQEQSGGQRVTELHITARTGVDFTLAKFFGWGGYKYESKGFPNPPVNNPREWVFSVRPVGIDSTATLTATVLQVSSSQYLAISDDVALEVNA
jgi:hypothetical protein